MFGKWLYVIGLAVMMGAALAAGCGGDDDKPPVMAEPDASDDETEPECIDEDGDGYGEYCRKGPDCDDEDPAVTDECYRCPECESCLETSKRLDCPCKGCPCEEGTPARSCEYTDPDAAPESPTQCHEGVIRCTDGELTACETTDTWLGTN